MKVRVAFGVVVAGALLAAVAVGAALAAGHYGAARQAAAPREPAITASRFSIVIDGVEIASFSELAGISSGADPVEFLESSLESGPVLKKLPGKRKPASVVLTRAMVKSMELWAWHEAVLNGQIAASRKSANLVMYGVDGKPVARYHLENAWPSQLEVTGLKAGASEVLMETVTIVCERIQRVSV